jgi:aspartyl aminopeptidase
MKRKNGWTKEEEEILVQAIKANPQNLREAFREVAIKLDRSVDAVKQRWYTKTRLTSVCFITVSQETKFKNGKHFVPNSGHVNSPDTSNKPLWARIKALLGWK